MFPCLGPQCKRKVEDPYLFCSFECAAYAHCFSMEKGFDVDASYILALKNGRVEAARAIKHDSQFPKYLPSITKELIENPPFETPKDRKDAVKKLLSVLKEIDFEVLRRIPHPDNLIEMHSYSGRAIRNMLGLWNNKELLESCLNRKLNKITNEADEAWLIIMKDVWLEMHKKECKECKKCQDKQEENKND